MSARVIPLVPKPRGPTERGFLPAALEIVETPASPTLRLTAGLIALFLTSALVWSYVGRVDIIATAPGKVVIRGRTKVVQPYETGVVRAIRVADGDRVEPGQILIELDPTMSSADQTRYADALVQARLDQARLKALLNPAEASPPRRRGSRPSSANRRQSLRSSITKRRKSTPSRPRSRLISPRSMRHSHWYASVRLSARKG